MQLSYHGVIEALRHLDPTPDAPLFGQPDGCDEFARAATELEFGMHVEEDVKRRR